MFTFGYVTTASSVCCVGIWYQMEEQDDFRGSEDLGTNRLFKDNGSNVEKSRSLIMQTNQNMLMQSSRVVEDTSLEGVDRERAFKMPS